MKNSIQHITGAATEVAETYGLNRKDVKKGLIRRANRFYDEQEIPVRNKQGNKIGLRKRIEESKRFGCL